MSLQDAVAALGQPATLATLEYDDLQWVLEPSFATEGQTFYLNLADGNFALLQMVYSTMGVSTSIQTSYRVFRPATGFNRMKTASHWASVAEFSDDKMSLSGDVISIQWDAALPGYRVRADIDSDVSFDFEFTFVGKGVTTKTYYNESEDTGYIYHKLIPRANVTGKITVEGEELNAAGTGFLVNAVQLNPQNVKRWNFCHLDSPEFTFMMMQFIMPEDYDYAVSTVNRAAVVLDGQLISVSPTGTVEVLEDDLDEETGYMAPVKLRYTFEGKTLDGSDPVHVSLTTTPATSQSFEKLDLLAELPWLVRKALQLLISKPFVFQYLHDQYEVEVQVGSGEKKTLKGRTFEETVHLS